MRTNRKHRINRNSMLEYSFLFILCLLLAKLLYEHFVVL
nr:MAG TPA: hypothetical protein [Caudoviricetes sp.]